MFSRFLCPDGQEVPIEQCFHKCRMCDSFEAERCLSLPTLRAIASQREWTGTPSTTQLIKGTRELYLEITSDYAIDPQSMIWAIFGTGVHGAIDPHTGDNALSEERIFDDVSSGAFDYFEPEPGYLYDRKTYGSFKTAKLLGLKKVRVPVIGTDGKQEKHKNGKPKFNDFFVIGHKSRLDVAIQLNDYRMKLESLGFKVNKQFVEVITRDGGTYIAKNRGIYLNAQLVRINKVSDNWISLFMKTKADRVHSHLENKTLPSPCSYRETWGGLKCQKFCHPWKHCDVGCKARENQGDLDD